MESAEWRGREESKPREGQVPWSTFALLSTRPHTFLSTRPPLHLPSSPRPHFRTTSSTYGYPLIFKDGLINMGPSQQPYQDDEKAPEAEYRGNPRCSASRRWQEHGETLLQRPVVRDSQPGSRRGAFYLTSHPLNDGLLGRPLACSITHRFAMFQVLIHSEVSSNFWSATGQ